MNVARHHPVETTIPGLLGEGVFEVRSTAGDSQLTSNDCSVAPGATASTCGGGSSCDAARTNLNSVSQVYYRVTVRVAGPRNTVSFVQSMVAL